MITRQKRPKIIYTILKHSKYNSGFAIVYRVDMKQIKSKSYIKTMIFNDDLICREEQDYFEFVDGCEAVEQTALTFDAQSIKSKVTPFIIQSMETQKAIENENQNRLIETKINSITSYFERQIQRSKKSQAQVLQEDVKRMRVAEADNLILQRDIKIAELEAQREIKGSFEILGVVRLEVYKCLKK
jgi:hypothetical protein